MNLSIGAALIACFSLLGNLNADALGEARQKSLEEIGRKKELFLKIVHAIEGEKQLFVAWDFADEDYYLPLSSQERVMEFLAAQPLYLQDEGEVNSPSVILNKILKTTDEYLKNIKSEIKILEDQEKKLRAQPAA